MVIVDFSNVSYSQIQPIVEEIKTIGNEVITYVEDDVSLVDRIVDAMRYSNPVYLVDATGKAKHQFKQISAVNVRNLESPSRIKQELLKYVRTDVAA